MQPRNKYTETRKNMHIHINLFANIPTNTQYITVVLNILSLQFTAVLR